MPSPEAAPTIALPKFIDVLFPGFGMASASAHQLFAGNLDLHPTFLYFRDVCPLRPLCSPLCLGDSEKLLQFVYLLL